jgi:methylmalonyl-CoA mutase cobalamin-binding domain/chain
MVGAALQEDADVLGVYLASPEHAALVEGVLALLSREGAGDIAVMVAGDLSAGLVERLQAAGAARVFAGEAGADKVLEYVKTVTHTREDT